jgi:hypothetical protein
MKEDNPSLLLGKAFSYCWSPTNNLTFESYKEYNNWKGRNACARIGQFI